MAVFKISLGIFYLRLVIRPWHRYIVYGAMIVSTTFGCILFFVAIFNCGNPALYLENEIAGTCIPTDILFGIQYTGAAVNAATDWTFAILPICLLAKAEMPKAAKVSAGLVLLLGCCGSIVSLIRIYWIKGLKPGEDFFNTAVITGIWSMIELGLGITAAAAATLRPLFHGLMDQSRTRVFPSAGSIVSASKSALGSSTHNRRSDTLFGDWNSPVPQHELQDLESQNHSSTHFSMTPVFKNSRIMSKMGISQDLVRQESKRSNPKARVHGIMREKSLRLKTRMSTANPNTPDATATVRNMKLPEATHTASPGEHSISRPNPHVARQQLAPPTPTFGQRQQRLFRVDPRRNGSTDWVPTVNTDELRSPTSSNYSCAAPTRSEKCRTDSSQTMRGPTFLNSPTRSERFPPQAHQPTQPRYVWSRESFLHSPTPSEGRPF